MASITDQSPQAVRQDMALLRAALDVAIPPKRVDRNLLVATWNIRSLAGFEPEWVIEPHEENPMRTSRDLGCLLTIAEILSRFDVVAVQELKGKCEAMQPIMEALGPHWSLMLTDINEGRMGNRERLGFVYDTRRVRLTGLAGELVLKEGFLRQDAEQTSEQFARAPYAAGLECLGRRFTLVSMHTVFGGMSGGAMKKRETELKTLARWLRRWVKTKSPWEPSLIAVGDSNINNENDKLFAAFTSTGLLVPDDLLKAPRLTRDPKIHRLYSQIAWFEDEDGLPDLPFAYEKGGSFDFGKVALASRGLDRRLLSTVISDHLPLWAEFTLSLERPDLKPSAAADPPKITDPPPARIAAELKKLEDQLDRDVPAKRLDRNLLICTWNIRAFGDLTPKWKAGANDSPQRDLHAVRAIAAILRRFDVVAVQEAKANLRALRAAMEILGPEWSLMLSDVTKGDPGNDERIGFLFDTRKIALSGLACELVVPQKELEEEGEYTLDEQFARSPYAVGFRCLNTTFTLVSLHVLWGKVKARVPELKAIACWLRDWAKDPHAWDRNLIVLGDLNISSRRSKLYKAFVSTGLHIPAELHSFPRTITSKEKTLYDQIAWFDGKEDVPALDLEYSSCGYFDFTKTALRSRRLSRGKLSHVISDHYPLWVEFTLRP